MCGPRPQKAEEEGGGQGGCGSGKKEAKQEARTGITHVGMTGYVPHAPKLGRHQDRTS